MALVGFMGAGKSAVGALAAGRLGVPFVDTDAVVEEHHGPIAGIFAQRGEVAFRSIERDVAVAALEEACAAPRVVSLGGGAVLSGDVRDALSRVAHVVWLTAPGEVLWERVMAGVHETRPLAAGREAFMRLLREREAVYAQVATARVVNDGSRPVGDVVDDLMRLAEPPRDAAEGGAAHGQGERAGAPDRDGTQGGAS